MANCQIALRAVVCALIPLPGLRSVVAESVLVRHQLLILNRGRQRAPNLRATARIIAGLCTLFLRPARVLRCAIVLKPSTLLHLHSVLRKRKYRMLFSHGHRRRPGPKGPNKTSSRPSWQGNDVILPGVVRELPRKSRWPSAWTSTRTWCAGFLEKRTD